MKYTDAGQPVRYPLDGPCSRAQWGAIQRELDRLGLADRGDRLQLAGQLAGRETTGLGSTRDLTAGEAGQVGRLLAGCRTLSDAWRVADPGRAARQWQRTRARLVRQLMTAKGGNDGTAGR